MRSLYESILDSDEQVKTKVTDSVELFNATVRSTFHEVFKDFLDFSSEEYSSFYLLYKLKNQNLSFIKAIEKYNTCMDMFIYKLHLHYKADVLYKSEQHDEVKIVINKIPSILKKKIGGPIYVNTCLSFRLPSSIKKMAIWVPEDYIYNIFVD